MVRPSHDAVEEPEKGMSDLKGQLRRDVKNAVVRMKENERKKEKTKWKGQEDGKGVGGLVVSHKLEEGPWSYKNPWTTNTITEHVSKEYEDNGTEIFRLQVDAMDNAIQQCHVRLDASL